MYLCFSAWKKAFFCVHWVEMVTLRMTNELLGEDILVNVYTSENCLLKEIENFLQ